MPLSKTSRPIMYNKKSVIDFLFRHNYGNKFFVAYAGDATSCGL